MLCEPGQQAWEVGVHDALMHHAIGVAEHVHMYPALFIQNIPKEFHTTEILNMVGDAVWAV
jgi:hypothetical protein